MKKYQNPLIITLSLLAVVFGTLKSGLLNASPSEISSSSLDKVKQYIEEVLIPAKRGEIVDRNGIVLAHDRSAVTLSCDPKTFPKDPETTTQLAQLLGWSDEQLTERLFVGQFLKTIPLKRAIDLPTQIKIEALNIPGVQFHQEVVRYYPEGEVLAPLLGVTNRRGGVEGIERMFDIWLTGSPERVHDLQDSAGNTIERLDVLEKGKEGVDVQLSLDLRLQQLAYQALRKQIAQHNASSGSVVVLDTDRGEVLAMANYPSFDPNASQSTAGYIPKNRAAINLLEPSSAIRPFTVVIALEDGVVTTKSKIDTSPGTFKIGNKVVREYGGYNFGEIGLSTLIEKSSNVGAAKLALMLRANRQWDGLNRLGFGELTGADYPGESKGVLLSHEKWRPIVQAVHSYGYGMSVTPLQLARAYSVLAEDGVIRPVSFLRSNENEEVKPRQVYSPEVVQAVRLMLERTVQVGAVGEQAQVEGYSVAGSPGTAQRLVDGKFQNEEGKSFGYTALFAGLAPVEDPKVVVVVVIDDPKGGQYTGGSVAAPLFSEVMAGALNVVSLD